MKINDGVLKALNKAVDHYGNISRLAKTMGIAHSTILFWLDGKTTTISGKLWTERVRPVLIQFMDRNFGGYDRFQSFQDNMLSEPVVAYTTESKPSVSEKIVMVPQKNEVAVVSFEQLANYDPTIESIESFAKSASTKNGIFANEIKPGYFALEISANCPIKNLPIGTNLLISSNEYANNGDPVIVRLRESNSIMLRIYNREGDIIRLSPLPGSHEKTYEWDLRKSPGYLFWIYPLIEANIQLRTKEENVD